MEIKRKLQEMSESSNDIYKDIANYLLNQKDYINLKMQDIQEYCHVSKTSVFRFCKAIDLSGFSEMKFLLIQTKEEDKKVIIRDNYALSAKANEHLNNIAVSFVETRDLLSDKKLNEVVKEIKDAQFIHVYAVGSTYLVAQDLELKLERVGIKIKSYNDNNLQFFAAKNIRPKDLAIGLTYSGKSKQVIESLRISKEEGAKTILMTSEVNVQFEKEFDCVLYISSTDQISRRITTTSRLTMLYVVDLIYYHYLHHDIDTVNEILRHNKLYD